MGAMANLQPGPTAPAAPAATIAGTTAASTPRIDGVLPPLRAIVDAAIASGTRDGYFAALYLRVTEEVKRRVLAGEFDDGPRMDRLDAVFAQRYLDAHAAFAGGGEVTASWRVAFEAGARWRPLILQHLLLGMNAHINLDLGIATVEAAAGAPLADLRADFDRINGVLGELTDEMQAKLAQSAPLLTVIDRFGGEGDEMLADFSIELARDGAFAFAEELAAKAAAERGACIARRDLVIAALGHAIARPGVLLSLATLPARLLERGTPGEIARRLS